MPHARIGLLVSSLAACSGRVPDYGFVAHLDEAIALNTERQPLYAGITDLASGPLSQVLIGSEQIALGPAAGFDERAEPFHAEGIAIVAADFVSMKHVAKWDRPPTYTGPWTDDVERLLGNAVEPLIATPPGDFEAICAEACDALGRIDELEAEHGVHLAMTKHVIESLGFGALHAIAYSEESGGRTDALAEELAGTQMEPLELGLAQYFDEEAAPIHALGAGIIVNDVPRIPFLEEYEEHLAD